MRVSGLVLVLAACAPRAGVDDVPIESAWLSDFDLSSLDVVVGTVQGDAMLGFDGPVESGALPVHLGGGSVGVALDLSWDPEGHDGVVEVDLSRVEDPVLTDVLGTYRGTAGAAAVLVGGGGRRMRNGRGAAFREGHFLFGIALEAGFEWIVVSPGGDDGAPLDTGFLPADHSGHGSHSGATVPPTSSTTSASTPPSTSSTAAGTGSGAGGGCGCRGDAEGCRADGCGCSTAGLAPSFAGLVTLLRRRRAAG